MIKNIILLAVSGLFVCTSLFSQNYNKHEVSVWGMGGLSTLNYSLDIGERKGGAGGSAGVGYTYFLNDKIGIGSGIEFSFYNAEATLNQVNSNYETADHENTKLLFKTSVSNYKETQNVSYLNIPIIAHAQLPVGKSKVYASGGIKVGIPMSGSYKAKEGTIKTSGYYKFEDKEYFDREALGFGTFDTENTSEDSELNIAFILSLEAGMKWKLQKNLALYTGLYFDYGLNDIIKDDATKQFIAYNAKNPRDFTNNSLLTSQYITESKIDSFAKKVIPMAIGIKIRLAFDLTN